MTNDFQQFFKSVLFKCSDYLVALGMTLLIGLLLFFSNFFAKDLQKEFIGWNFLFVILMIMFIVFIVLYKDNIKFNFNIDKIVKYLVIIFFIVQIYVFYNIFFETDWDVEVIRNFAMTISRGENADSLLSYFTRYPNNMFIASITTIIMKLNNTLGIFTGEYANFCLVFMNCLISSYASYLTYKIVKKIVNEKYAFIGYLLMVGLIVFSPWNVIFYSDSLGLLFPVLIVYVFLNMKSRTWLKYVLIFGLGYLGYMIKPQCIIIVISIILCMSIKKIYPIDRRIIRKGAIIFLSSGLLLFSIREGITALNTSYGLVKNDDLAFGISHFFMMGMNADSKGIYNEEDVLLSQSYQVSKDRVRANISVAKQRISSLGLTGVIRLMCDKAMINFNDGTFAWGAEGSFYTELKSNVNTRVSPVLKKLYYTKNDNSLNEHFKYFATFTQFLWINVLFFVFYKTLKQILNRNKSVDYNYQIIIISLLGLTIFELIFEARARYLYTYVPLFITVAMCGFKELKLDLKKGLLKFKKR